MTRPYAPKNQELFDQGLAMRRQVLGSEYVDASIKNATDFNIDMQELVTQYCWGDVWNRPGLERKTRSFLNLAMISALNRPHELKLHVRGAINNGLTKDEIKAAWDTNRDQAASAGTDMHYNIELYYNHVTPLSELPDTPELTYFRKFAADYAPSSVSIKTANSSLLVAVADNSYLNMAEENYNFLLRMARNV